MRDQFSSFDGEGLVEQDIRGLKGLEGIGVCGKSFKLWSVELVGWPPRGTLGGEEGEARRRGKGRGRERRR